MKKLLLISILTIAISSAYSQDAKTTMEKTTKELYRVLSVSDKEQYKKFMKDNYTKELLEKPVRLKKSTSDSNEPPKTENSAAATLEAKVQMYAQLHNEFGDSKLASINQTENQMEMVLKSPSGLTGTFTLVFSKSRPYLIDRLGVQAEMGN